MNTKIIEVELDKLIEDLGAELEDIHMLFLEYINEMKDEMDELRKEMEKKDWNMVQRTAHNIKGVSINLGLIEMHGQAEVIDLMMKNGIYDSAEEELSKLVRVFNETEKGIKKAFEIHGIKI